MKLQIAFNSTDLDQDLVIAKAIAEFADSIEIGPVLLGKYGLVAVEKFREALPNAILIADTHIVEFASEATKLTLDAGADWISVLAGANRNIIHAACSAAHDQNKKIILDLVDTRSKDQAALEAKSYGADAIMFHSIYENYEEPALIDEWDMVRGNTNLPIFISGKIDRKNIVSAVKLNPYGISIGSAITQADDPKAEAACFRQIINPEI